MCDPVGKVLRDKYAKFHHAIQLHDFEAYCNEKAVLSRLRLTQSCNTYTAFYTDAADQQHGVWNRTFGNLQDFGSLFWFADKTIPNLYGPITLTFDHTIWDICTDVALTKTNPGDAGYDLNNDRLSAPEVASCFTWNGKFWNLSTFGLELSVANDHLAFDRVKAVTVEPVNDQILQHVRQAWHKAGFDPAIVKARDLSNSNQTRGNNFQMLVAWATSAAGKLPIYSELPTAVPSQLKAWFGGLRATQYPALRQWLEYTYNGTIR